MIKLHFTDRERNIFLLLLVILSVGGIYNGIYIPFQEEKENISKKILLAKKQLKRNMHVVEESKELSSRYKKIFDVFTQNSSDEEIRSAILSDIEYVAGMVNMPITDIKPQKTRKIDFYNQFSVSLTIDGDLEGIVKFVHILQEQPYMYYVNELSIDKKTSRSVTLRCRLVLSKVLIP